MAILNNNPLVGASGNQGGYNINNSLRFRRSATAYLNRTPVSASNRKTFTYSAWIKRGLSGNNNFFCVNPNTGYSLFSLNFDLNVSGDIGVYQNTSGTDTLVVSTNALFRDFSAWYHIVIAIDTTQATAANRVLIYVNGVSQALTISTQVALNTDLYVNSTLPHFIGREQTASGGAVNYFDGYMADVNFIDGSAKTPSDFGETDTTTGVWKPKAYSGTYGTNGFYLKFSDIATTSGSNAGLGKDFSGNSNYWTTNNISVTSGVTYDAMTDSPTNTSATVANYCVLNPLDKFASLPVTNGNLTLNGGGGAGNWWSTRSTIWVSSGKWYWESTIGGSQFSVVGVAGVNQPISTNDRWVGFTSDSYGYYGANGNKVNNNTSTSYGSSYTAGDVIGVALDMDAGTIVFYKNNTSQGTAFTGVSGLVTPGFSVNDQGTDPFQDVNFGQRPFAYTPPTGYVALNTYNLPDSTIKKGNKYMDATLYTGNGGTQTVTNAAGFKPDFVWLKERSSTSSPNVYDSIRGTTKYLLTNTADAEGTDAASLTAFNSNGFSLGGAGYTNENAQTYVGWQWQAGQGSTSSNTSGSITSTVSVNTTAGFSVVTYTGTGANATVGHGLGVAPKMIIVKNRNDTNVWAVYHASVGAGSFLQLASTAAQTSSATVWNSTAPTSTVFSIGTNGATNQSSGQTYVAYCWAEIAGFSKFGSYTGNGSADGPFVATNFAPKFVMTKRTDTTSDWIIYDTSRNTYNVTDLRLFPNLSNAETQAGAMDLLSNGFKLRDTGASQNASGGTYIYACFASSPFKNSNAR